MWGTSSASWKSLELLTEQTTSLELSYETRELRDLCLSDYLARKTFGDAVTEKLLSRLADLAVLEQGLEIFGLPGNPKILTGKRSEQVAIKLSSGCAMVFESGHGKKRLLETGETDWSRIRRIKILAVEYGHD